MRIQEAVNKLKSGKTDGDKGYMTDHLILAPERLHRQIAMLFTAMLIHGHQPDDLLLATITSIPKDNQADIYSDIVMSPTFFLLFSFTFLI